MSSCAAARAGAIAAKAQRERAAPARVDERPCQVDGLKSRRRRRSSGSTEARRGEGEHARIERPYRSSVTADNFRASDLVKLRRRPGQVPRCFLSQVGKITNARRAALKQVIELPPKVGS